MTYGEASFAAIDFESAGSAPGRTDAPIQLGIALMESGIIRPEDGLRTYLSTDRSVTWTAQKVHGITDDQLAGAPTLAGLWPEIHRRLSGRVIVAHSAATEKRFLRLFPTHRFGPWVDTLAVARDIYPNLSSHRLGDLVSTLRLQEEIHAHCPELQWHDALYDATASLVLLRHLIQAGTLGDLPIHHD